MPNSDYSTHTRTASVVLASCGILILAFGFFMTGPRLVEFVTEYLSEDRALSEGTKAELYAMHLKIVGLGVVIALAAMLPRFVVRVARPPLLWMEGVLAVLSMKIIRGVEKILSAAGRLVSRMFDFAGTEKCMWLYGILVILTISVPGIFLAAGGLHVEGVDLQPAKNLVRHGIYGTLTTRGFDELTHRSSAGPGIILPNALIFYLFGINNYFSRSLHVVFLMAALVAFYWTARKLYEKNVAILAVYIVTPFLLMVSGGDLPLGGEGYNPGLFYFLSGTLLWFKAIETHKNFYLILSGLLWGFAFQTKWLFLFAVFALIITCICLYFAKKSLPSKYWLVPTLMVGVVTAAWVTFRILNLGLRQEIMHIMSFWEEHGHRAIGLKGQNWADSMIGGLLRPLANFTDPHFAVNLWGDLQFFLVIPALLYIVVLLGKNRLNDYKSLFLLTFCLVWFSWWFVFNYDLPETHLKIFLHVSQLFVAKFLYDLWQFSAAQSNTTFSGLFKTPGDRHAALGYMLRVVIVCIILGKVFVPLTEKAGTLYKRNEALTIPYKEMMTYIRQNTESNAVFSGWDWSMPWYVDLDEKGDHIVKDRATYLSEQREVVPEYFIVSPEFPLEQVTDEWPYAIPDFRGEAKKNEKRKKFLEEQCTFLKAFGGYKHKWLLYRVNSEALGQLPKQESVGEVS
jgi:hypothetical protein